MCFPEKVNPKQEPDNTFVATHTVNASMEKTSWGEGGNRQKNLAKKISTRVRSEREVEWMWVSHPFQRRKRQLLLV